MEERLQPVAKQLEITQLLDKYPYEVSGGQKQRAAVARALVTKPQLLLADEPTGALDSRASKALLDLFTGINEDGQTIVMVTHSVRAASTAKRVLFIKDGEVFHQLYRGNLSEDEVNQLNGIYNKIDAIYDNIYNGSDNLSEEEFASRYAKYSDEIDALEAQAIALEAKAGGTKIQIY